FVVSNIDDYFWKSSPTPLLFTDSINGTTTLKLADTGGLLAASDGKATSIVCRVSEDSVYAAGFLPNSLIDLDDGSYFSGLDAEILVTDTLKTMCNGDSTVPIIGTSGGVFDYIGSLHHYVS